MDQNCHIWVLREANLKTYRHIWNQQSQICQNAEFHAKLKNLNFETKNALFGVGIWKRYYFISNQHTRIFLNAKFHEKWKSLNLGPIMTYLGIFARIWKCYCHIWNQQPRIRLIAKFGSKIKIIKSWTKNDLFGYFWAEIWK